jgi:sarcosine oxidase
MSLFDLVVVGLGAHGSAVAAHAAASGLSVCGLDAGAPPHDRGSHHGESRIIRQAYFEGAPYVPLLLRAYRLWDALQAEVGESLFSRTGGLMLGRADGNLVSGALHSARLHGLAHEALGPPEIARRFPAFRPGDGMAAVFEPQAGVLRPEACVRAHLRRAEAAGAVLRTHCRASLEGCGDGWADVRVETAEGESSLVRTRRVAVCAGAGLAALGLPVSTAVQVERQVVAHFAPRLPAEAPVLARLPVFLIEEDDGRLHYGFPDLGTGVKVARHHGGLVARAGRDIDTAVHSDDIDGLRRFLAERLPSANGSLRGSAACRYANTPDRHFVIDRIAPQLVVVSACSGHGFKFASVIGEIVSRLVRDEDPGFDLRLFEAARLAN